MTGGDTDFERARERYAGLGVDAGAALAALKGAGLSLPCWPLDDVSGFERPDAVLSGGGIAVTGVFPGRARNVAELRADLDAVLALVPGRHRVNLHAIYGEFGGERVDRDAIGPRHFAGWAAWARERGLRLDFNATCFSHPLAAAGWTLSSTDPAVRSFWIEHVRRAREIAAILGREQGGPSVHDLWIPDGAKEEPADRLRRRALLRDSLDEIYAARHDPEHLLDAVESKLFGLGSESFVAGSHEFYLAYALTRGLMVCYDTGHFHPTESVADKLSSWLLFAPRLLLHVSRGVRWDSDHTVLLTDDVRALMREVVRCGLDRVHLALDFFDGSIDRVGSLALGARAVQKALLLALLEPRERLAALEEAGDGFGRLALAEAMAAMPFGAVWDRFCDERGVPRDHDLAETVGRRRDWTGR